MMRLAALALAGFGAMGAALPPLTFVPVNAGFNAAAEEYRQLWCAEGPRIVAAMERVTGFPYPAAGIEVFVAEATPMTAFDGRSMWLKASYPNYYKRATLVHEMGHRLGFTLPRAPDLDDHRLLNLFLYDVWTDLYGAEFADRMVQIERRIAGRYDYAGAWDWALAMTREQRQARLAAFRTQKSGAAPVAVPSTEPPPDCARNSGAPLRPEPETAEAAPAPVRTLRPAAP